MGFFEKLKNTILGEKENECIVNAGELTNQGIMDRLVKRFEWEIKYRSVEGQMIYPMAFVVVLHNNDYQDRKIELQMFMPKVVKKFYGTILKYREVYHDYTNPGNYWSFRFIPSMSEEMELDGKTIHVEEGNPVIIVSILDEKDVENTNKSVNVSMPVDKSGKVKKMNINMEAFGKFVGANEPITVDWMDPEEAVNGIAASPEAAHIFDKAPKSSANPTDSPLHHPGLSGLGAMFGGLNTGLGKPKLAYKLNGETYIHKIESNECWVCGNGAETKPDTFVINSGYVKNPHLLIRKDAEAKGKLYLAAFALTLIEDVQMPVSSPEKPEWILVDKDVNINLNGFKIKLFIK